MKRIWLFLWLTLAILFAQDVLATGTVRAIAVQEVSTVAISDSGFSRTNFALVDSTAGVIFPNDERTFVVLYDSTGGAVTATVTKPAASIFLPGYGYITLSDLTYVMAVGYYKIFQIPLRYNSSGKITMTVDTASRLKIAVYRLKEQR